MHFFLVSHRTPPSEYQLKHERGVPLRKEMFASYTGIGKKMSPNARLLVIVAVDDFEEGTSSGRYGGRVLV